MARKVLLGNSCSSKVPLRDMRFRNFSRILPVSPPSDPHHLVEAPQGTTPAREEASPDSGGTPPGGHTTSQSLVRSTFLGPTEPNRQDRTSERGATGAQIVPHPAKSPSSHRTKRTPIMDPTAAGTDPGPGPGPRRPTSHSTTPLAIKPLKLYRAISISGSINIIYRLTRIEPRTVAKRPARHFIFGRSRVLTPVPPDQIRRMLGQYQPRSTYHLPSTPILTVPIPNLPVSVAEKALEILSSPTPSGGDEKSISKRCRDQEGVAKVGCARNDKTECGTGKKALLIHSGFDLQSSRRYVQYFPQPFCDHVLNIYRVQLIREERYPCYTERFQGIASGSK
ncbi:hypothetical protein GEV33_008019 [Tenebrio molitor]|uniref:Uncharacterized protein n=1 Tax=Tenebrio molitor TaxID=7067 RepID=A0A8J6HHB9_TENMO|nr:hypothetical protein GEV33_008019 [Tenebrio molitor]